LTKLKLRSNICNHLPNASPAQHVLRRDSQTTKVHLVQLGDHHALQRFSFPCQLLHSFTQAPQKALLALALKQRFVEEVTSMDVLDMFVCIFAAVSQTNRAETAPTRSTLESVAAIIVVEPTVAPWAAVVQMLVHNQHAQLLGFLLDRQLFQFRLSFFGSELCFLGFTLPSAAVVLQSGGIHLERGGLLQVRLQMLLDGPTRRSTRIPRAGNASVVLYQSPRLMVEQHKPLQAAAAHEVF
jgi:hypothetical protein